MARYCSRRIQHNGPPVWIDWMTTPLSSMSSACSRVCAPLYYWIVSFFKPSKWQITIPVCLYTALFRCNSSIIMCRHNVLQFFDHIKVIIVFVRWWCLMSCGISARRVFKQIANSSAPGPRECSIRCVCPLTTKLRFWWSEMNQTTSGAMSTAVQMAWTFSLPFTHERKYYFKNVGFENLYIFSLVFSGDGNVHFFLSGTRVLFWLIACLLPALSHYFFPEYFLPITSPTIEVIFFLWKSIK